MRDRRVFGACFLLLAAACSPSLPVEVEPPGTVTLAVGGQAAIRGTGWTIAFDSVVSDSRCPMGVLCIQAGEALLALKLTNPLVDPLPGDAPQFTLGATSVTKYGFRFTAVEVMPLARIDQTIDRDAYRVALKVEMVGGIT